MEQKQDKSNEAQTGQLRQADVVSRAIQDLFAQGRISLVVDGDKYYNRVSISVYIDEKQVYGYDGVLY